MHWLVWYKLVLYWVVLILGGLVFGGLVSAGLLKGWFGICCFSNTFFGIGWLVGLVLACFVMELFGIGLRSGTDWFGTG